MLHNSCVIVHEWPIVEIGLRNLMQPIKIEVLQVYRECPDIKTGTEWRDALLLIDIKYHEYIRKHQRFLKKRGVSIVGLDFNGQQMIDISLFDEVLLLTDSQGILFNKLNQFSNFGNSSRTTNQLSSREIEVLKLVALGQSNKQISDKLFISIHTVITHRKHITGKLGIKSISGLTLYAVINNLIEQP